MEDEVPRSEDTPEERSVQLPSDTDAPSDAELSGDEESPMLSPSSNVLKGLESMTRFNEAVRIPLNLGPLLGSNTVAAALQASSAQSAAVLNATLARPLIEMNRQVEAIMKMVSPAQALPSVSFQIPLANAWAEALRDATAPYQRLARRLERIGRMLDVSTRFDSINLGPSLLGHATLAAMRQAEDPWSDLADRLVADLELEIGTSDGSTEGAHDEHPEMLVERVRTLVATWAAHWNIPLEVALMVMTLVFTVQGNMADATSTQQLLEAESVQTQAIAGAIREQTDALNEVLLELERPDLSTPFVSARACLYAEPDGESAIVGEAHPNQEVRVEREQEKWLRVVYFDRSSGVTRAGWVAREAIRGHDDDGEAEDMSE